MTHEQKVAEVRAAYEAARDTFKAYNKARTKVEKCRLRDSLVIARGEYQRAEKAMRIAAACRDKATNLYGIEITKEAVDQARAAEKS